MRREGKEDRIEDLEEEEHTSELPPPKEVKMEERAAGFSVGVGVSSAFHVEERALYEGLKLAWDSGCSFESRSVECSPASGVFFDWKKKIGEMIKAWKQSVGVDRVRHV
ncbi:hypothetical protein PVK06_024724 [Gossypium arboreum]|uniref:RNase H type-1 domain-containing protein n=1 Tax=Gossypium arboreum TaxID=29729 RepID=A0ABR0PEP5_GOSAR|nr:hypothetical protein PVK06_024724 [Gossypium arboreum]